jgi:hypothetical protein
MQRMQGNKRSINMNKISVWQVRRELSGPSNTPEFLFNLLHTRLKRMRTLACCEYCVSVRYYF